MTERFVCFTSLGQRLLAARERRGLSLRALSAQACVAPTLLNRIERDQYRPHDAMLRAIASALEIDPAVLASGRADLAPPPPTVTDEDDA